MQITPEELKRAYRRMSDEELVAMDTDDLTEVARNCHADEMERRGLQPGATPMASEGGDGQPWASAGTFRFIDEAQLAISRLEAAGIPAELESDTGDLLWISTSAFKSSRVLVPEAFVEKAHAVIESHAAEEELAAQAAAEQVPMVTARYEDGVFTPVEPVDWEEGAEVEVRLLNSSKPGADH
jgi:hypothetical protein